MIGLPIASAIHDRGRLVERLAGEEEQRAATRGRAARRYFGSCFFRTRIAVGAVNIAVTLYFSTRLHQMPASGRIGRPSYMIVAMPAISGP